MKREQEQRSIIDEIRIGKVINRRIAEEQLHLAAVNFVRMPPSDVLTEKQQDAAMEAASVAGERLHQDVGHFDFAKMSEDERNAFIFGLIIEYNRAYRQKIIEDVPFD